MVQFIEAPLYTPEPGDRIRIVISYAGEWRPFFWFALEKDGSIYLGPRFTKITLLKKGAKRVQQGQIQVKYEEGQVVDDRALLKNPKVSFHGSGVIRAAGDRFFRDSLRTLKEQQLICGSVFLHPSNYAVIPTSAIRDRDICLKYPIDETKPMYAFVYAAPASKARIVRQPSASYQVNLFLSYPGDNNMTATVVQVVLAHGPAGPWPPYAYILFGTSSRGKLE